MVTRASSCLRRAAAGDRAKIVQFGRFLANENVTLEALLAGWGEQTAVAVAGRHVLAIQDTSEIILEPSPSAGAGWVRSAKGPATVCCCMQWPPWMPTATHVWVWLPGRFGRAKAGW